MTTKQRAENGERRDGEKRRNLFRSDFRRGMRVKVTDATVPKELRALTGTVKVAYKGNVGVVFESEKWPAARYEWIVSESHCLQVSKSVKGGARV